MEPLFDQTAPPERVGPYRIDRAIGRGGMGTVWRAWDERLKRQVTIKQIRADTPLSKLQQRLWREAQAAARLNHPAIVHIYDLVEDAAGAWIVMELVAGKTLRDLMDEQGPLPFAQAVRLGLDVAEGLAEAHSHGILHRDLKASNVMVTPAGRAKILDFGLAKQIQGEDDEDQEASITRTGVVIGTCYAMSPEQVLGKALDARSDLFSLGSLLYEILTGEPPFRAEVPTASMALILSHQPSPVEEARPGVPRDLASLIGGLLEKEPDDRPRSAREVVETLAGLRGLTAASTPGDDREADFRQALELAREWLEGARRSGRGLLAAHGAMSHSFYFLSRLTECLHHAETVLAFPPTEQEEALTDYGLPPRVGAAYYSSWALVHLGMEKEAVARHELAVELAETHADPFGMAMALGASITFHIRRHDLPAVLQTAERMKSQAVELGIPGEESLADRAKTWALAEQGDADALREFLSKSASRKQRVNGKLERGWACHQIGVLFLRLGKLAEAGVMIEKGLSAAREGELLVEPHLVCLKGELRLAIGDPAGAEATLREAFEIARQGLQTPIAQRALSSLAPLLESQGRHAEGEALRAQVIDLKVEVAERVREIFAETGAVFSSGSPARA